MFKSSSQEYDQFGSLVEDTKLAVYVIYNDSPGKFRLNLTSAKAVDINQLARILTKHSQINTLELCELHISKQTADKLVNLLAEYPNITTLNLGKFKCSGSHDEVAIAIAKTVTIESLSMTYCYLTDRSIEEGFAQNTSIKSLYLYGNNITDDGGILLAKNEYLTDLSLAKTSISDQTAIALGKSKTLKNLTIAHNKITDEGFKALASNDNSITWFDLFGNKNTNEGTEHFLKKWNVTHIQGLSSGSGIKTKIDAHTLKNKKMSSLMACRLFHQAELRKCLPNEVAAIIYSMVLSIAEMQYVINIKDIPNVTYETDGRFLKPTIESKEKLQNAREKLIKNTAEKLSKLEPTKFSTTETKKNKIYSEAALSLAKILNESLGTFKKSQTETNNNKSPQLHIYNRKGIG